MEKQKMTREESIRHHRMLWNWISEQNAKLAQVASPIPDGQTVTIPVDRRPVTKNQFFKAHGIEHPDIPVQYCYACQTALDESIRNHDVCMCDHCPLDWTDGGRLGTGTCINDDDTGLLDAFTDAVRNLDLKKCAEIAKEIAEIPEKN